MPYPVEWDANRELFSFTTAQNIKYELSFIKDDHLNYNAEPINDIYQFLLIETETNEDKRKFDIEIAPTVKEIITTFFEQNPNSALVYSCDDDDERGRCRSIVFNKWFKNASLTEYHKFDSKIEIDTGVFIYSSLILHKSNQNFDLITSRYIGLEQNYKGE